MQGYHSALTNDCRGVGRFRFPMPILIVFRPIGGLALGQVGRAAANGDAGGTPERKDKRGW